MLGSFLYNNYVQALKIIEKHTAELSRFKTATNIDEQDFEAWHREELAYLKGCVSEPESDAVAIAYVEELQKLQFRE